MAGIGDNFASFCSVSDMNLGGDASRLAAEQRARVLIDRQLGEAGWSVQDKKAMNLFAAQGVAVREVTMKPGHGRADYLLYVDQRAVGVIEAKPEGTPLSGVEWQSAMYAEGLPAEVRLKALTDGRPAAVRVRGQRHRDPLHQRLRPGARAPGGSSHFPQAGDPGPASCETPRTTRSIRPGGRKVRALPPLDDRRRCARRRSRRSTASSGASPSSASTAAWSRWPPAPARPTPRSPQSYRLLKHGGFNRILFLVDRNNLADQTMARVPELPHPRRRPAVHRALQRRQAHRGRRCSDVDAASRSPRSSGSSRRCATRRSPTATTPGWTAACPTPRSRSPTTPTSRRRRSTWSSSTRRTARSTAQWRGVLEYFDAHIVGLTATPGQADVRVLPAEPRLGVHLPAVGGRQRQRRLRHLPDQDPDQRAGLDDRGRHGRPEGRPPHPRPALRGARRGPRVHRPASSTGRSPRPTRSARCWRPSATGCSPRSSPAARPCRRR